MGQFVDKHMESLNQIKEYIWKWYPALKDPQPLATNNY
jgi:hypothetical protein